MSYQEDRLRSIANAIRTKGGTSDPISANDFATAILNLPSGGGGTGPEVAADSSVPLVIEPVYFSVDEQVQIINELEVKDCSCNVST